MVFIQYTIQKKNTIKNVQKNKCKTLRHTKKGGSPRKASDTNLFNFILPIVSNSIPTTKIGLNHSMFSQKRALALHNPLRINYMYTKKLQLTTFSLELDLRKHHQQL